MDFKELMQRMQQIDEGLPCDKSIEECGDDMPAAIIQGSAPSDESLNMNVTINSKGADGIRDLMDILKGISGDSKHEPSHHDADKLFGNDEPEIVIGDNYGNEVPGDAGPKVFNNAALLHQGKGQRGEVAKVNGGGNPQVHESLITHLAELYENIKSRNQ